MAKPARLSASIFFGVLATAKGSYGPPEGFVPLTVMQKKTHEENCAIDFTVDLTATSTRREALWRSIKQVSEVNNFAIMRQQCTGISGGFAHVNVADVVHRKLNVASVKECAVLCAVDGISWSTTQDKVCQSFTYINQTSECNFHGVSEPALYKDPCCDSGSPCPLDGVRDDIQEAYQADIAQGGQPKEEQEMQPVPEPAPSKVVRRVMVVPPQGMDTPPWHMNDVIEQPVVNIVKSPTRRVKPQQAR